MGQEFRESDPAGELSQRPGLAMLDTQRLCEACVESLPIDGAVVALIGQLGSRETVHSTNSVAQELDELQFILGEGPCVDAFSEGVAVLVGDLSEPGSIGRWPGFAPAAVQAGARAAFAFPLEAGSVRFGVLELYRSAAGSLVDSDLASAQLIAKSAARIVLTDVAQSLTRFGTHNTVNDRADIHRATGMIAIQLRVSVSEALLRLRAAAFAEQQPIRKIADSVLDGTRTFTDGSPP